MNKVLPWIKSNLVTVIALALAIIALPVAWFFASGMATAERERAQENARRAQQQNDAASLTYEIPAIGESAEAWSVTAPPNPELTDRVAAQRRLVRQQSEAVREAIVERNRRGKDLIVEGLFPEPVGGTSGEFGRVTLTERMFERWDALPEEMVSEIGAGSPPELDEVRVQLEQQRERRINEITATRVEQTLTAEEQRELGEELAELRRELYRRQASELVFYAFPQGLFGSRGGFDPDGPRPGADTFLQQFWDWQHTSWVEQDILRALADANRGRTTLTGPVKRVISIDVPPMPFDTVESGSLTSPIPPNFERSFTGRAGGNAWYDIRRADVQVIAAAGELNELIEAFGGTNFMTVIDMDVDHLGTQPDLLQGYDYGDEPVARVDMTIETVWIRSWYEQWIPNPVRESMGLPLLGGDSADGGAGGDAGDEFDDEF